MSPKCFDEQMNQIRIAFPDGLYDKLRVRMIWDFVKDTDDDEFRKIVRHMIGTLKKAPMPADFVEECRSKGKYFREKEKPIGWSNQPIPEEFKVLIKKLKSRGI